MMQFFKALKMYLCFFVEKSNDQAIDYMVEFYV